MRCASKDADPGPLQMALDRTMCLPSRCFLREVDTRQCASKDAGPKGGWIWWGSHIELEKETSVSEDVGPQRWWIVMSHIDWR